MQPLVAHQLRRTPGPPPALRLEGRISLPGAAALWADLLAEATAPQGERLDVDLSGLEEADGIAVALLVHFRARLRHRGVSCSFTGARPRIQSLIGIYEDDAPTPPHVVRRPVSLLVQVGRATERLGGELKAALAFLWQLLESSFAVLSDRRTANWKELPSLMERAGADAVPIVSLINLLVGFVMGFQSASQLKLLGANIFVADLVSISVTRELGPLMTAIILSGRSGAAYAAEVGSMAVNEELSALRTLGFDPVRYLVLPRLVTMMIVTPALTLIADLMGILGGLVAGMTSLGLTPRAYFLETQNALHLLDPLQGLIKAVAFGGVITLIACQQGLATSGGAQGVGQRTTAAVVAMLFCLILVDALFTPVFRLVDLWLR